MHYYLKVSKASCDLWAANVVNFDGKQRYASSLIPKSKKIQNNNNPSL